MYTFEYGNTLKSEQFVPVLVMLYYAFAAVFSVFVSMWLAMLRLTQSKVKSSQQSCLLFKQLKTIQ